MLFWGGVMPILSELEQAWKPQRDELAEVGTHEAIRIRLHRAFSWMKRAGAFESPDDADGLLIYSWIALNALYARWQPKSEQPPPEWSIRRDFLEDIAGRDEHGRVQAYLREHRAACDRLLSEEHLHIFYWSDPSPETARSARSKARRAGQGYHLPEEIESVLLPLIDRIATLRSQLVHGQATHGSGVNREIVVPCAALLNGLVLTMLHCIVEDGLWDPDEPWQPVPFPPMEPHFRR